MTFLLILATMLTTVALIYLWSQIKSSRIYKPAWLCRLAGEVPWARIKYFKYAGADPGEHDLFLVSRHEIAECGLTCPTCKTVVADRGDFSHVERTHVDGDEAECIKCFGLIRTPEDDVGKPCPNWLIASPDTEHGDHLNDAGEVDGYSDCPPEFYRFKRITPRQALVEKYGVGSVVDGKVVVLSDITDSVDQDGTLVATGTAEMVEQAKTRKGNGVCTPEEIAEALRQNPDASVPTEVLGGAHSYTRPGNKL